MMVFISNSLELLVKSCERWARCDENRCFKGNYMENDVKHDKGPNKAYIQLFQCIKSP